MLATASGTHSLLTMCQALSSWLLLNFYQLPQESIALYSERIPSYSRDTDLKRIKYIENTKEDGASKNRDNILCSYFLLDLVCLFVFVLMAENRFPW